MKNVILHLTDLHFGWEGNDVNKVAERKLCLKGLIKALSNLEPNWKPNIICISGDIGWKGSSSDYVAARKWLDKLLETVGIGYDKILVCAGNHDIDRKKSNRISRPMNYNDAQRVLNVPLPEHLIDTFSEYNSFCNDAGMIPYKIGRDESFLCGERQIDGIRFVAFNSSWFCQADDDKEKLWIGLPILRYLESEDQLPILNFTENPLPTVAIIHHPFEWLHSDEKHGFENKKNTKDYLAERCHLLLTGHEHGEDRKLDMIAQGMYHSTGGAVYAGEAHNNNVRLFSFDGDDLIYRSLKYDPGSSLYEWRANEPQSLAVKGLSKTEKQRATVANGVLKVPKKLTLIPLDSGGFFGREEDMQKLTELLNDTTRTVLITGIGGIGKTTFVKRFIKAYGMNFDHVAWITVDDGEQVQGENKSYLKEAFMKSTVLFDNLALPFIQDGEDANFVFARLMNALRNFHGNNLLVIDNVGIEVGKTDIKDELPHSSNWKVLLTSKQRPSGFKIFELDKITPQASLDLFFSHYTNSCNRESLKELLQEIDFHTLTIELFAKTLESHYGALSVEFLLEKVRSKKLDDPNLQRRVETGHGKEETEIFRHLTTLFGISSLAVNEVHLMKQLTLLPPGIYNITNQLAVALQCTTDESLKSLHETIGSLKKLGWIKVSGQSIEIHRIVHQIISYQEHIQWEEAKPFVESFTVFLNYNNYKLPKEAWEFVFLAEYLIRSLGQIRELDFHLEINSLRNNLAAIYKELGRFQQAKVIMEQVLAEAQANLPNNHPSLLESLSNLGLINRDLGHNEAAANLLERAMKVGKENYGEIHPLILTCKSNLGLVYKNQNRLIMAVKLLEEALADSRSIFSKEDPQIGRCLANLATVYQDMKKHKNAAKLLEEALQISETHLIAGHPDIARNQSNLSMSYQALGRHKESIALSKKALDSAKEYYGEKHRIYVLRLQNLGVVYAKAGSISKSLKILDNALMISTANFGPVDLATVRIRSTIAGLKRGH